MYSTYLRAICALAAGLLLGISPTPARAQDANRDAALTVSQARDIVDRLDKRTGEFKEEFDKAVEHSLIDGSKLEDRAKKRADDLHDAAKKLRDVFNDKKDKNNPAVRDQVDKVLAAGADVNKVMTTMRFTEKLQRDWDVLRSDLNALAQIYGLSPI
jgi:hypothetical protein